MAAGSGRKASPMTTDEHIDREALVEVTVVHNEVEANIIKSLLEEAGIDCVLVTQVPHAIYPININGLGETRVKVLDHNLEAAQAILREYKDFPERKGEPDA
jgi:hypothetical protein